MPQTLEAIQIGSAIRAARRHRGLTLRQIEERCGMSNSWVSTIERGKSSVSMATFLKLARAVEMEPWKVLRFACKNAAREGDR